MKTTTTTTSNLFRANIAGSTAGMSLMPAAVPAAMSAMMVAVLACTAGSAQAQSVVGWGSNLQGQLNGTSSVGAVTEISSGIYHNVGARQDGTIVAWGSNNAGQLDVPTPALTDVTCVSAGDYHSIAARANGTVACWGDNFFGACDIPVGLNNVVGVSAGEQFSGALLADGTVVVWGWDSLNRLGVPADLTRVIKLDLGADFGVALRSTGNVVAWGTGTRALPPIGLLAKDISAGVTHSIAIRLDGTLACWGTSNLYGECTPPLEAAGSVAVAAGSQFSLGLRSDGKVVCWGKNNRGQAPAAPGFAPVTNGVAIAAGFEHSIASQNPAGIQAPTATLVAATATSCGNINGAIDVTVTNAETSWWTGPNGFFSNSDDLSGLAAGSYTLLVVGPGGSATLSVEVTAGADTIAPVIASYNASASDAAGANCTAIVPDFTASVVASDNCTASGALTITQSPAAGASVGLGANTVVITVKDSSLNQTTANATFTVSGTAVTYYNDADTDGFGAINDAGTSACSPIVGKVVDHTDCNDMALTYGDGDSDGFGAGVAVACGVLTNNDCNDNSAAIYPGATEVCNHIDDNCVGGIDEGLIFNVYYRDADSDGYGDTTDTGVTDCVRLPGTTTNREDCNDSDGAIHPGTPELCADSTVDNNCDGVSTSVDTDAADKVNFYRDEDLDTYSINVTAKFCTGTINAGYVAALSNPIDCVDTNAAIHPGAAELCADSTIDNNCDGVSTSVDTDAADKVDFYRDQDGDTYSINVTAKFCPGTINAGYVAALSSPIDCNDLVAAIHPGAAELCADSTIDNNCDGVLTGVDTNAADKVDFYRDQDGDTYSINVTAKFCPGTINAGYVAALSNPIDCVDTNAAIHPGAAELCADSTIDNNCNGVTTDVDTNAADKVDFYRDQDGDGYSINFTSKFCTGTTNPGWIPTLSNPIDCIDTNAAIHPGAAELCADSTVDNNCNGVATDVDLNAADKVDFYRDQDGDGYSINLTSKFCSGTTNPGWIPTLSNPIDCVDTNAAIYPGAAELCADSTIDNNCNDVTTDVDTNAVDKVDFYRDEDNDNYSINLTSKFCTGTTNPGWIPTLSSPIDCNDLLATIHPGAAELCADSTIDNNCNGVTTDVDLNAADKVDSYRDQDGDGYSINSTSKFCSGTTNPGWIPTLSSPIDCDDTNAAVYPGAVENCANDGIDNDCDGEANSDIEAIDAIAYFPDLDGDTFGAGSSVQSCTALIGRVPNNTDCDDTKLLYTDGDNDVYGAGPAVACGVLTNSDCNDNNVAIHPGAAELCADSTVDNNCNGVTTDVDVNAADKVDFYRDEDNDNYSINLTSKFCTGTTNPGWIPTLSSPIDCNDLLATIHPGAAELCADSTIDNNCNGVTTDVDVNAADKVDFYRDEDNDNYSINLTSKFCTGTTNPGWIPTLSSPIDCVDTNAAIYPGAAELCADIGTDNNCINGINDVDTNAVDKVDFYRDQDGDGYSINSTSKFCTGTTNPGWIPTLSSPPDCNDLVAAIYPSAPELCADATVDNNCNGVTTDVDVNAADKVDFYRDEDNDNYSINLTSKFCTGTTNPGWIPTLSNPIDCVDTNAAIYPGAAELCADSTIDNNCNDVTTDVDVNAADKVDFYRDEDNDNYSINLTSKFCTGTTNPGWIPTLSNPIDCVDTNAAIYPGAAELCADSTIDNNCNDVTTDVDVNAADKVDFYRDEDNDNYSINLTSKFCTGTTNPGWIPTLSNPIDCVDTNAAIYPGAAELCADSTIDNNCNDVTTDVDVNAADKVDFYRDEDNDNYSINLTSKFCTGTTNPGWIPTLSNPIDCVDTNAAIYPGAAELCADSTIDNNCNDVTTDVDVNAADKVDFYRDEDNDNYSINLTSKFCTGTTNPGWIPTLSNPIDCVDTNAAIYPGAAELCADSTIDNNCNDVTTDVDVNAADKVDFYRDEDNDNYSINLTSKFCTGTTNPGWIPTLSNPIDCVDTNAAIYPGAAELCADSTIDNNCNDVTTDVDVNAADKVDFYRDEDNDNYSINLTSKFCTGTTNPGWIPTLSNPIDCVDTNAAIYPGAAELCADSTIDNNCNDVTTDVDVNAADKVDFYRDEDNDNYSINLTSKFCTGTTNPGWIPTLSSPIDCVDTNAAIYPGAAELCADIGTDNNCINGINDVDTNAVDKVDFYRDEDNDNYSINLTSKFCTGTTNPGWIPTLSSPIDCDDTKLLYADNDVDTFGAGPAVACGVAWNTDCNDTNATIYPGAPEQCNNLDDNCNGTIDDGITFQTYYTDADGDGYGATNDQGTSSCSAIAGKVLDHTDCDDTNAAIHPGAAEVCNGKDDDCVGGIDDGLIFLNYYTDDDSDTYGALNAVAQSACAPVQGKVPNNTDCNDSNGAIYPGALETCANLGSDNDCDLVNDAAEASDSVIYYVDTDNDGYGAGTGTASCTPIAGSVTNNTDCNNANSAIYPGAPELCANSTVDNNCDGVTTSVDLNAADKVDFYRDQDGDGYSINSTSKFCAGTTNPGWIPTLSNPIDCVDTNAATNPGAAELCADIGTDNNCTNGADDVDTNAADKVDFFRDEDLDTYSINTTAKFCPGTTNPGWKSTLSSPPDCIDTNAAINPGAAELCADIGTDNNCINGADDVDTNAPDKVDFFRDEDLDTYSIGTTAKFCPGTTNTGWKSTLSSPVDCDDTNAARNPGAAELCADIGTDNNCINGADDVDTNAADKVDFFRDEDNDTYSINLTSKFCAGTSNPGWKSTLSSPPDCIDTNAAINPGAAELCADIGTNNNCDLNTTDVDTNAADKVDFFSDQDNDNYSINSTSKFCPGTTNPGWIPTLSNPIDCNDTNAAINPGATEQCNGIDDDCNILIDDGVVTKRYYIDADRDTYGASNDAGTDSCSVIAGKVLNNTDCNDNSAAIHPGVAELCADSTVDNNCDGVTTSVDVNAADKADFFRDQDLDTYSINVTDKFCPGTTNPGWKSTLSNPIDCNDTVAAINPGAAELCADIGTDNNCIAGADDVDTNAADKVNFFRDQDLDTYSINEIGKFCTGTTNPGWIPTLSSPIDCNDSNAAINPGATEVCNGADDDCVLGIDNGLIFLNYYTDADSDTYGALNAEAQSACAPVPGKVPNNTDCNDSNAAINPGATEICDGLDNNCDGRVDDGLGSTTYYRDADNDGCGDPADFITTCATTPPAGYVTNSTDGCPTDAAKCSAGTCGCGTPDDADGNNIPDCLELDLSMLPPAPIAAGTSYVVRINAFAVSTLIPMNGMQLAVKFDATRLQLASIDAVAGTPFNTVLGTSVNNTLGTLKYAIGIGADQTGMTSSADLVDLVFTVKPGADLCAQDIQLAQLQTIGSFKNVFVTNTNIGVNPTLYSLPIMDLDSTKPVITGVPASVTAAADPGSTFGAFVPTPTVLVTDNCNVATSGLLITYPNLTTATAWPIDGMFPVGLTTLKWSATDDTGNETIIDRTIDIANWQLLTIKVQFDTRQVGASTRSIRVTTGTTSQLVNVAMPAWVGATPSVGILADIHIPIAASYSCISAKDNVHSLSAVDFSVDTVGNHYETSFTLIEGDSNDDNRIDVLDFSIFVGDQGNGVATNARSNFNADTLINNADFSCISINFFKRGDTCVAGADADAPLSRVSVKELRRQGLGNLAAADMNGDGWVDLRDMQIYLQGGQAPRASGTHDQGSISGW